MTFLASAVARTIEPVLEGILAAWRALPAEVRAEIERAIRAHGPAIYQADVGFSTASAVGAFLDALWPVRQSLPADVRTLLEEGQVEAQPRSGYRSPAMGSVSAEQKDRALKGLLKIVDFRLYDDPPAVARELQSLVERHRARLTDTVRARWDDLRLAFQRDGNADRFLEASEALLRGYPEVDKLLSQHKVWARRPIVRGGDFLGGAGSEMAAKGISGAPAGAAGQEVSRYANVHFPDKVLVTQQEVPLVVHVAGQHVATSRSTAAGARMTLRVGALQIVIRADGFAIVRSIGGDGNPASPHIRTVQVWEDRDCEPLVFFLTPQSAGVKRISLDFYQEDRPILNLLFDTEVVADLSRVTQLTTASVQGAQLTSPERQQVAPPDLELRVMLSGDKRSLSYYLHSPGGADYNFKPVGTVDLGADPLTFLKNTFDRLSTLAKQTAAARSAELTARNREELADIGHNLYDSLFPADTCRFKQEYAKTIRTKYAGKGLLITSDDPWIPWEMIRPRESDEDGRLLYDDAPLCETFRLTRWLAGRGAPDQVKMAQGTLVAPPDNLQAAQEETRYFEALWRQQWQISFGDPSAFAPLVSLAQVQDAFARGGTQLFHFACHGNFNTDDPGESKLKLGADFLRPSQITGARADGLKRSKPVVFLNACHSGRVGFGLTQLGGWAQRFLDLGASAFIGSLWEVNDQLAARFAREFYNRLWGLEGFAQQDLGRAFYEARMVIKAADEANPTWLAYVLYGDPHGQVVLGGA